MFVASASWSQLNSNTWIHSYIKLKNHWDPAQTTIQIKTCLAQEITPVETSPGEGYYPTLVNSANVIYSLTINGNSTPFNGYALVTNFSSGTTVNIALTAQVAGYPDYVFDADVYVDGVNPTITYNTTPDASIFNLPASLLRTTKGDTGGCDGELKLNISGGYPSSGTNPYIIMYDNVPNYHLDYLDNLCSNSTVTYKWGDSFWGCKPNYCDPNISSNCSSGNNPNIFCNNDGFFCDDIIIETRSCSLGHPFPIVLCDGMFAELELIASSGSNSFSYDYAGSGNFSDIYNPSHLSFVMVSPYQNYTATVNHLDGSVFTCSALLTVDIGYPHLDLLNDSSTVCLGDTIKYLAGAYWHYSPTYSYQYLFNGNYYNSNHDNNALDTIIIVTDSLGVFDLTLIEVTSIDGCSTSMGISTSFEVRECNSLTIEEYKEGVLDFKIYPNPTNSTFTISIKSSNYESLDINIYDALGKKIVSKSMSSPDDQDTSFDLSNYSNGVYYVEIQSEENRVMQKIVLNK